MDRRSLAVVLLFASLSIGAKAQATYTAWVGTGPEFNCHGNCNQTVSATFHTPFIGGARSPYLSCDSCLNGNPFGFVQIQAQGNGNSSFIDANFPAVAFPVTGNYEIDIAVFGNSLFGDYPTAQVFVDGVIRNLTAWHSFQPLNPPVPQAIIVNDFGSTIQYITADGVFLQGNNVHDIGIQVVPTTTPPPGRTVKGQLFVGQVAFYPHDSPNHYLGDACAYSVNGVFSQTFFQGIPNHTFQDLVRYCENTAANHGHKGAQIYLDTTLSKPIGSHNCGSPQPQCFLFNVQ